MGGGAAGATGRAIANTWRPPWQIFGAALLIAFAVRFLHYALFWEPLFAWRNALADYGVLLLSAAAGYQLTRAQQMADQYPWAFERTGLLWWRPKSEGAPRQG
jgi:hypothetical protein